MIGDFPIYAKDMRITLNMAPGRDTAEKHRDWVQTCPLTQAWQVHPTPSSLDERHSIRSSLRKSPHTLEEWPRMKSSFQLSSVLI